MGAGRADDRERVNRRRGVVCLLVAAGVAAGVTPEYLAMRHADVIVAGPGVTAERLLSHWLPAISGTAVDRPVYVLDGPEPGGTLVVLGGTHGDESAGYVVAVVLVEHARVRTGRVLVLPRANASGFTHNVGQEAHPQRFSIDTPDGRREFTYGADEPGAPVARPAGLDPRRVGAGAVGQRDPEPEQGVPRPCRRSKRSRAGGRS